MRKAAEYRALAFQAFNLARWQLDADLDKKNVKKLPKAERKRPRAVIVDIDETVLDNSAHEAATILGGRSFGSKDWFAFTEKRVSKAVPGAVDFINYANSKGIKVFYVSNRDENPQKQATIDNLKTVGLTDVSDANVLLRTSGSTKEPRRSFVARDYRVVLMIGDNLDDFSDVFENAPIAQRYAETEKVRDLWGKRFIVLPNAIYGSWEKAIYEYGRLTEAQKAQKRAEALELP
jgi:5'-nucleotidase (lipoprotein e(P4) family)